MFCKYCGCQNSDTADFCKQCGKEIRIVDDSNHGVIEEDEAGLSIVTGMDIEKRPVQNHSITTLIIILINAGLRVFWVGAKRYDQQSWSEVSWRNGTPIKFTKWFSNEPSYISSDTGYSENYLMCFYVDGQWYYNDAPNDVKQYYKDKMGYIVEFEGGSY